MTSSAPGKSGGFSSNACSTSRATMAMVLSGVASSWAVPAAFLFSYSSEKMFRWTLTNRYFGPAMFDYYATGKTIPQHAKIGIMTMIAMMTMSSATFVWYVSTLGDGMVTDPSSWTGADPGYGAATIILVGSIGVWWLYAKVETRK